MHALSSAIVILSITGAGDAGPSDFETLKSIAGEWKATPASGKSLTVAYRTVSRDSVLVETYGAGSGHETLTLFHPDRATVMATHYCAQGNQPRLRLQSATPNRWVFTFYDATNLPDANASHLVRLELQYVDRDHLVRIETYREGGKDDTTRLELSRSSAAPKGADATKLIVPN